MKIQVVACDNYERTPARTYEIRADDGRWVERDLCGSCAAPLEALLGDACESEPASAHACAGNLPPAVPAARFDATAPRRPAAGAPAEEKPAGRTTRRRTRITTLEEIEAMKKAARQEAARRSGA
ncbi:hypothetical protein AB0O68_28450 [Streptomyces sp. NPDC087512]|uniref:hypothetical protein n=1 Tax=Streptomyces sp. NPDC087512 TaxID=3155059 RepID=UPI00341D2B57